MFIIVSQVFFGLLLASSGFYLAYYYVVGVDAGTSPLLLVLSIILIVVGVYYLLKAGKSDDTVTVKVKKAELAISEGKNLKRNNDLVKQWKKTMDQRDRLKLLEMSGETKT
jgi:hypothetical protein